MIGRGLGRGEAFSFSDRAPVIFLEQEISVPDRTSNRYECSEVSLVNQTSYPSRTRGPDNIVKRPMMIQHHSRVSARALPLGKIVHFMKQR